MENRSLVHIVNSIFGLAVDFAYLFKRNIFFVNGFFKRNRANIVPNNWGDDINVFFLEYITKCKVLTKNASRLYDLLPVKNYLCIGSTLGLYDNPYMEVWGSGFISSNAVIKEPIGKIWSVRGPLTRASLMAQGVDCPEYYGDPALLVSRFYKPKVEKKYRIGIVPHYTDAHNQLLKDICEAYDDILVISMTDYDNWKDIPNAICSCEKIVSSSLHGLIISDSYSIPNAWVKFSDNITGGSFKYLDYFGSVGRKETMSIRIDTVSDFSHLISDYFFDYAHDIDYDAIINSCPFKNRLILPSDENA